MRRCVIIIITVLALFDFQRLPAQRWLPASPWHVRTNLVHDVLLVPNVGAEYELSDRWTVVADASVAWWVSDRRQRRWGMMTGEVELRRWLGWRMMPPYNDGGHHLGFYGALYRYDLAWGGTGRQGDLNYGAGISYGYAISLSGRLSLDLSIGIGYLGGRYVKYEADDGRYVKVAEGMNHYFGPTKLEETLVWHLSRQFGRW